MADQPDAVVQPGLGDGGLQFAAIAVAALVVAGQDDEEVRGPHGLQPRRRLDGEGLALPAGQPPGQQEADAPVVVVDPPPRLKRHDPLRRDPGRIEAHQIDAARNGDDLGRVEPMLGDDVLAGEVGIGDGQSASCHHGIIPALQQVTRAVEAMIGGDARDIRRLGRGKGRKGRRARAHMHQIDRLALDQRDQPAAIGQHDQRVLRLHRHGREHSAARLQIGDHAPAVRGDDGAPAGLHHRLGHIQRRLLGAAGVQVRNHLQQREIGGQGAHRPCIAPFIAR